MDNKLTLKIKMSIETMDGDDCVRENRVGSDTSNVGDDENDREC